MIGIARRIPPVATPVAVEALARAAAAAAAGGHRAVSRLREAIAARWNACGVLLTDSGTSALALGIRAVVGEGGVVAMPGFACYDLATAAQAANVRVRLYDVDPETLGPDPSSLRDVVRGGIDAVVIAHFFGYPVDVAMVRDLAPDTPIIEDAAQAVGAALRGRPCGALGDVAVFSFGRGKGVGGGGGGAVLALEPRWARALPDDGALGTPPRGVRTLARVAIQELLGRPATYAIPSAIPGLRLGETVYHPPRPPAAMSNVSASLALSSLARIETTVAARTELVERFTAVIGDASGLRVIQPVPGATPAYLRLPLRDLTGNALEPAEGILRSYPRPLGELEALEPLIDGSTPALRGARALCETLITVPTHSRLAPRDVSRIAVHLASVTSNASVGPASLHSFA